MRMTQSHFGQTESGASVPLYTLTNDAGHSVSVTPFGATVTSIVVPDRHNRLANVVLGYDTLTPYLDNPDYLGSTLGRCANRIANGRFVLEGKIHQLTKNQGTHHLHGGVRGLSRRLWSALERPDTEGLTLELTIQSPDGEEGYPGNLFAKVRYRWDNQSCLRIEYLAVCDKSTHFNPSHHSYFNLLDGGLSPILDHRLQIDAERFASVEEGLIPTGRLEPVEGTPFDFRRFKTIGPAIQCPHPQLQLARGFDHSFSLVETGPDLCQAAVLLEPVSGRTLTVSTSEPALHLYTGNYLGASTMGQEGQRYAPRQGLCLETQHFPNSPNQPHFPSTQLIPGETFFSRTDYVFGLEP